MCSFGCKGKCPVIDNAAGHPSSEMPTILHLQNVLRTSVLQFWYFGGETFSHFDI